jgi:uncharacterized protein YfiM (DUF2279 family)
LPFRISIVYRLIIIFLIVFICNPLFARPKPESLNAYFQSFAMREKKEINDKWLSPDKGYHLVGSLIGTTLVGQMSMKGFDTNREKSQIIGVGAAFSLGLAKEFFDSGKQKNKFSWKDLTANGVGIIVGVVLLGIN